VILVVVTSENEVNIFTCKVTSSAHCITPRQIVTKWACFMGVLIHHVRDCSDSVWYSNASMHFSLASVSVDRWGFCWLWSLLWFWPL